MKDLFHKFSLDQNTADFVGHAMCLYRDDKYVQYFIYHYYSQLQHSLGT